MPIYRSILRSPLGKGQEFNVVKIDNSKSVLFVLVDGDDHDPVQKRIRIEVPHQVAVRIAKFIMGLDDARKLPGMARRQTTEDDTLEDDKPGSPPKSSSSP